MHFLDKHVLVFQISTIKQEIVDDFVKLFFLDVVAFLVDKGQDAVGTQRNIDKIFYP